MEDIEKNQKIIMKIFFLFNGQELDEHSTSILQEKGIRNWSLITVQAIGSLKGGNFII